MTMTTVEGSEILLCESNHKVTLVSFVFTNEIMLPVNTCFKSERWDSKCQTIFFYVLSYPRITQSNNDIRA